MREGGTQTLNAHEARKEAFPTVLTYTLHLTQSHQFYNFPLLVSLLFISQVEDGEEEEEGSNP
jgi:hypothetical protein